MSNDTDPRNDRPSDDDRNDDRPRCEGCACLFEEATDAASTDGINLWCSTCTEELAREAAVESALVGPMTTAQALGMAVEVACGGSNLLNGREPEDDLDDETVEIDVETMGDMVHGRREGRAS